MADKVKIPPLSCLLLVGNLVQSPSVAVPVRKRLCMGQSGAASGLLVLAFATYAVAVMPVPARGTEATYDVPDDSVTCKEWAYQPTKGDAYFFLVGGKHCDDETVKISKGSQLKVVNRVLQGRIGFGAKPAKLSELPPCYNQIIVFKGTIDGTGAGSNGGSLGTSIATEDMQRWKDAIPGRQIIIALELKAKAAGITDDAWVDAAMGGLGKLTSEYSASGFELDPNTGVASMPLAQKLIDAVEKVPWAFVSLVGPGMSLKGYDTMGMNGAYWPSYASLPQDHVAYYVFTVSHSYVSGGLEKIPITSPVYGVTIDSIDNERCGETGAKCSCATRRRLIVSSQAADAAVAVELQRGSTDACVSAACRGGCCPTCWVANKWGVPCT